MAYMLKRCKKCGKFHSVVSEGDSGPKTFHIELHEVVPECED